MSSAATQPSTNWRIGTDRLQGAVEQLRSVERLLWLLVLASLVLDLALTYEGLRRGLAEGNPVMAMAIESGGIAALALAKLVVLAVAAATRFLRPRLGPWLSLGIALPWGGAATVNASLLVLA